jgi:integrase
VWSIRAKLQLERRTRDLTLFNLAIDSKLRGCDLVALRVDDVAPNGYAVDRANIRQRKTGRPVRFELTEVTRQALDDYLRLIGRSPQDSCPNYCGAETFRQVPRADICGAADLEPTRLPRRRGRGMTAAL